MPTDELSEADYHELLKYREPHAPSREEYDRLVSLKRRGFVKLNHFAFAHPGRQRTPEDRDTWIITPAGEDVLSEFENERRKESEDKRQQRFQNQISVAQVLIPLVTFVLGLIIDHYTGLVSLVSEFLGRWIK